MSPTVRVLLVEDSRPDADLVRLFLADCRRSCFEVMHVTRLREGVELMKTGNVGVVLLDLGLPDAVGRETLDRALAAASGAPIIVMTGQDDEEAALEAMRSGAQDYLVKGSFDGELLERSIRYAIGRVEMLKDLRESEERYALAVQGAKDGIWDWSLPDDRIYYSVRWLSVLGYEPSELPPRPEEWLRRIHPDDQEMVRRRLAEHISGRTAHFEAEHRIQHKDGGYRWVLCRGLAVRRTDGKAQRLAGSMTDITDRKEVEGRLVFAAFHDDLTGLANRALLLERLNRALLRHDRRPDALLSVLSIGIDRFSAVSDAFGPTGSDELARTVAVRLASCVEARDTLARTGAEQFALLLEDLRDSKQPELIAAKVLKELGRGMSVGGLEVFSTASIGITIGAGGSSRPEDYLRNAEIAMHSVQKAGGGKYQLFGADMHDRELSRLQLEKELRAGAERGEFCMYFQPLVQLDSGRITGFEALLRWNHPERGLVPPMSFLPLAEESELLGAIFASVLPGTLQQLATWQRQFPSPTPISLTINLSRRQLRDPLLVESIAGPLKASGVLPYTVGFEITESMMMEDTEEVTRVLQNLRNQQVRLYLDDFGTGYSSLSNLQTFPFDVLKVDKTFVQSRGHRGGGAEITQAIVKLGQALGMMTVAEGIETPAQLKTVMGLHCQVGQGYLFGAPMPAEQATELLRMGATVEVGGVSWVESVGHQGRGRVLVVDDDAGNRRLFSLQLEEGGFEVASVASGTECLQTAQRWKPEVILMDVNMPGVSGIEACRRLKHDVDLAEVPVLFVTGRDDEAAAVEALSAGGADLVSKDTPLPVLLARLENQIAHGRDRAKLQRLAMTDELTGLYSRRYLLDFLRKEVKVTCRRGPPGLGCLLVDIDHFKAINDSRGHLEGDRVLRRLAEVIEGATRESDRVARFGGEELVIILPDTDLAGAITTAEKVHQSVLLGCAPMTVSIGVAHFGPKPGTALSGLEAAERVVEELIRRADAAMYLAKARGRSRVIVHDHVLCPEQLPGVIGVRLSEPVSA